MTSPPLVSVVIPLHNNEAYVGEAIESVLDHGHEQLDVIVVDDGSTDRGAAVAEQYSPRVRVVSQEQGGIGAARNAGVELARGEFLGFLDADDRWLPGKLARQLEAFAHTPAPDLVFGHLRQFVSPDLDEATRNTIHCPADPQPGCLIGALLMRLETFERVGPFRTERKVGEFVDWMARSRELGLREVMLPEVVLERRLHGANSMIRWRNERRDYLHVVKASLDRRRERGVEA